MSRTTTTSGLAATAGRLTALLAGALLCARALVDPDLWGHLTFGADILSAGRITTVDPYSFTQDVPWVNHEWLSEVGFALAYRLGGVAGLVLLAAVAATIVNRYGTGLWHFLSGTVRMTREISEWRQWRAVPWAALVPVAGLCVASLWVDRLGPLFAIVSVPLWRDAWSREPLAAPAIVTPVSARDGAHVRVRDAADDSGPHQLRRPVPDQPRDCPDTGGHRRDRDCGAGGTADVQRFACRARGDAERNRHRLQ